MLSSVFVYMILSSIVFITKTHNYISEYLLHLWNLSTEVNEHNYENWEVFNETSANTSSECRIWHPGIAVSLPANRLLNSFRTNSFSSSSENNTHELTCHANSNNYYKPVNKLTYSRNELWRLNLNGTRLTINSEVKARLLELGINRHF